MHEHRRLALPMALWIGQRQGDLPRLPWSAYDGEYIHLRQSKGGRRIIPASEDLKAALAEIPRTATTILTNMDGMSWTEDGFRTSWGKAWVKAGIGEEPPDVMSRLSTPWRFRD